MAKTFSFRNKSTLTLRKRKAVLLTRVLPPADLLRALLVEQYVTCGKKNCRCRRGFKHGPFFYLVQCISTHKVRKFLLKTPDQRRQARTGIDANRKVHKRLLELSEINTELLRRGDVFLR